MMTAHLLLHATHALSVHVAASPTPPSLSGISGASDHPAAKPFYDAALAGLLQVLIFLANLIGGAIIGIAIVREFLYYLMDLVRHRGHAVPDQEAIRLSLGRSLALALEFQLGADILGTALDPSLQDLLVLAAIALLRTFLNFSLGREIDAEARRIQERGSSDASQGGRPTATGVTGATSPRRTG